MTTTEALRALLDGPCGTARHGCPVHVDGYDCLDALRAAARAALAAPACRHVDAQGRCADCRRYAVLLEAAGDAVPEVVPAKTKKSATPLLAGLVKIREQHDVRVGGPSVTVSDLRRWASEALTAYLAGAAPVGWSQNTPLGIRAEHGGARLFVVREGTGYGVVVSLGGFATEAEAKAAAEAAARGAK